MVLEFHDVPRDEDHDDGHDDDVLVQVEVHIRCGVAEVAGLHKVDPVDDHVVGVLHTEDQWVLLKVIRSWHPMGQHNWGQDVDDEDDVKVPMEAGHHNEDQGDAQALKEAGLHNEGLDGEDDARVPLVVGLHNEGLGDAQVPKEVGLHIADQDDDHMVEQMGVGRCNLVLVEGAGHHSLRVELHRVEVVHRHHVGSARQNEVHKGVAGLASHHKVFVEGHEPSPQHQLRVLAVDELVS